MSQRFCLNQWSDPGRDNAHCLGRNTPRCRRGAAYHHEALQSDASPLARNALADLIRIQLDRLISPESFSPPCHRRVPLRIPGACAKCPIASTVKSPQFRGLVQQHEQVTRQQTLAQLLSHGPYTLETTHRCRLPPVSPCPREMSRQVHALPLGRQQWAASLRLRPVSQD